MSADFIRERITALRLQKNLSEYQLSYALGQSRGYIQSITSGRTLPSMAMLFEICDYFEITPAEFFTAEDADPVFSHQLMEKVHRLSSADRQLVVQLVERLDRDR